jgi:hypothetical protein
MYDTPIHSRDMDLQPARPLTASRSSTDGASRRGQHAEHQQVVVFWPSHHRQDRHRAGALVYVMADGPFGREAFRIDLQGGPLVVRVGWLALRRATGVPTLPVLTHREGNQRVIVIHPPLPDPDGDAVRDAAACRAALTPLVDAYVRRFPTQCRWVAIPRWPTGPSR